MKDLFGEEIIEHAPARRDHAHAARPGTGPLGQFCRDCASLRCHTPGGRRYYKCGLVAMTAGPATDIRLKDPACQFFKSKEMA